MSAEHYSDDTRIPPVYENCVVNSLPCRFKMPMVLFWGAIFTLIVSWIVYASTILDMLLFLKLKSSYFPFTKIMTDLGTTSPLIGALSSAFIVVLLYFFAQGTKALGNRIYSNASILMYLYAINLGFSLLSIYIQTLTGKYLIGFCALILSIVTLVYIYKLGKQLREGYEGRVRIVGRNMCRLIYFLLGGIGGFLLAMILGASTGLSSAVYFALVLTVLWFMFVFVYTYFGVYYKMASILQPAN